MPKSSSLTLAVGGDQHVGRLQVAVHDQVRVGVAPPRAPPARTGAAVLRSRAAARRTRRRSARRRRTPAPGRAGRRRTPASNSRAMCGCSSDARIARSRAKRWARPRSIHSARGSFSATWRSNAPSARSASQTRPCRLRRARAAAGTGRSAGRPLLAPGSRRRPSATNVGGLGARRVAASSCASSGAQVGIGRRQLLQPRRLRAFVDQSSACLQQPVQTVPVRRAAGQRSRACMRPASRHRAKCKDALRHRNTGHRRQRRRATDKQQPRALPVASHRAFGQAERFGDLLLGQTAEVAHLDDLRQARIGLLQFVERLVDPHDVVVGAGRAVERSRCSASRRTRRHRGARRGACARSRRSPSASPARRRP